MFSNSYEVLTPPPLGLACDVEGLSQHRSCGPLDPPTPPVHAAFRGRCVSFDTAGLGLSRAIAGVVFRGRRILGRLNFERFNTARLHFVERAGLEELTNVVSAFRSPECCLVYSGI